MYFLKDGQQDILDMRQLALKLAANCVYGCLGKEKFRFSALHLASLITQFGRENLNATAAMIKTCFPQTTVVYGDTDSLMIKTGTRDEKEAMALAQTMRDVINRGKICMSIEIAFLYRAVVYVSKKRYAALEISLGGGQDKFIVKGLESVRRDTCRLAKTTMEDVLRAILQNENAFELCQSIVKSAISKISSATTTEESLVDFEITKVLSKHTDEYGEAKGVYHVEAARIYEKIQNRRIIRGESITYVVCVASGCSENIPPKTYIGDRIAIPSSLIQSHFSDCVMIGTFTICCIFG
jgi:DNA polymerase alpha subunit A